MREKVKEIPEKFKVFWDKYTSKQKTIVIAIICVVLIAIGVVAWLASRPTWSKFQVFDSVKKDKFTTVISPLLFLSCILA